MEIKSLKNAIAATSLLVGLAGASSAQADPFPQVRCETLGVFQWFTDVYQLTCPIGTTGLSGSVTDLPPVVPPLVSLQIFKPSPFVPPFAIDTTDPVDGDGAYSPPVTLAKSSGQYYLLVDKTGGGIEQYCISVVCNGGATPPPVLIQDQ